MRVLALLIAFMSFSAFASSNEISFTIKNHLPFRGDWDQLITVLAQGDEAEEFTSEEMYIYFSELTQNYRRLNQASQVLFRNLNRQLFPATKNVKFIDSWLTRVNAEGLDEVAALSAVSSGEFSTLFTSLNESNQSILLKAEAKINEAADFEQLSAEQIFDFYDFDASQRGLKLMVFCRHNRAYPCRLVVKDLNNELTTDENGKTFSLPQLAKSKRGLPFNQRNGNTPQGMHDIDAVMPYADQPISFGKYRRLKLEFISGANQEAESLELLPASLQELSFWKQANIARDIGRSSLRVHGTGKINEDPTSTFYPHMPTSGCISSLEGKYGEVEYKNQRILLDHLMTSLNLEPVFKNETSIRGTLYLIELDEKEAAVTLNDLKEWGLPVIL